MPLAALFGVGFGGILCDAAFDAGWAASGIVIVSLYTVALSGSRQRSLVVGALTAMVVIAAILLIDGSVDLPGVAMRVPLVLLSLALGDTIRSRPALRGAARERAERAAREREEEHRRRIADERLRIAHELHDTLAHSLVSINVQAGVAVDLDGSQDSSAALKDIKEASATALARSARDPEPPARPGRRCSDRAARSIWTHSQVSLTVPAPRDCGQTSMFSSPAPLCRRLSALSPIGSSKRPWPTFGSPVELGVKEAQQPPREQGLRG